MNQKIAKVIKKLEQDNIDGLILSSPSNISYLTDYRSRDSYLMVSRRENFYITDARYSEEARRNLKGFTVEQINGSIFKKIADICHSLQVRCLGFEERHLSYAEYKKIRKQLNDNIGLVATCGLVEQFRQIKTPEELEKIRIATQIAVKAFRFIKDFISTGKKEIEIAAELERFIRYNGASSSAFDIIVASGPNSSFPHHITSQKKVKKDELVLLDLGVDYQGYKSDLTRVFFSGKITSLAKSIHKIVVSAQAKAIAKIKPGRQTREIDFIAREYIRKSGYGGFFSHSLGHGIGLDVHEEPGIAKKEAKRFEAGMVFTVEPAIYLTGKFGIRIEDMVLVTRKGSEVLSGTLNK